MLRPPPYHLPLVAYALLAAGSACATDIVVTGGTLATIPGTIASGTWGSITVSGTGPSGARSTLTIDTATVLTADPFLTVTDGGLLSMRADVTSTIGGAYAYGSGTVSRGGTLDLVSGTLTAEYFTLSGSDAFRRSGGAYALGNLEIADGATASFQAGDVIARQRYGAIWVKSGGTLSLGTTLSSTNGVGLGLSGSNSRLVRTTGTETLRVSGVGLYHSAALDLIPGDAVPSMTVTGSSVLTLAPGATSLRLYDFSYGSGGRIAGLERVPYDIDIAEIIDGQRLEYRSGAIDDRFRNAVYLENSGTLSLQKDLVFSSGTIPGVAGFLQITGTGSRLERNGHAVTTEQLWASQGAMVTVGDGLTVGRQIYLYSGTAGPGTEVTLADSVVLQPRGIWVPELWLSGAGSRLIRSHSGITISATGGDVYARAGATLPLVPGDDFAGSLLRCLDGGSMSSAGPQSFGSLVIRGRDATTGAASVFTASAGRFTVTGTATISGSGSLVVNRAAGASYDISTLVLDDAATATLDPLADRVHRLSLGVATRFTTLATGSGLALDGLDLDTPAAPPRLVLGGFSSEVGGWSWGLRLGESYEGSLRTWLNAGTIVGSAGQTLSVARQGGYAYVITGTTPPTPPSTLITITVASGTQTQTQAGYATLSGSMSLLKRGAGTLVIQGGNTMTGSTAVQEGTLRFEGGGLNSSTIVPLAGGTVAVGQDWVAVGGLLPLAGGLVDVERNLLFVQAGLSEADIRTAILAGRGDGSWNGAAGITSTTVAAEQALGLPRAIGWKPVGGDELSVGYAALGDANLDWSVDILDAADVLVCGTYDSGRPAVWYEGDFNYDAAVDILDAASFVSTGLYDTGVYRPLPVFQDSGPVAAVPEPTAPLAAGVLLVVVAWAAVRRS